MSLWTAPPSFRLARGPALVSTLAVCLARVACSEVEFVTDDRGAEIAASFGWTFDRVRHDLEEFRPAGRMHIWALGKLKALSLQDGPSVHIDNDVLLLAPEFWNREITRRFARAPFVAQSIDQARLYAGGSTLAAIRHAELPPGRVAYNAGVIGGAAAREYALAALDLSERFAGNAIKGTPVSMIVEQYFLGRYAEAAGAEVQTLLSAYPSTDEVRALGYSHLSGGAKSSPRAVARCERRLSRDFPEAYARFLKGWEWEAFSS